MPGKTCKSVNDQNGLSLFLNPGGKTIGPRQTEVQQSTVAYPRFPISVHLCQPGYAVSTHGFYVYTRRKRVLQTKRLTFVPSVFFRNITHPCGWIGPTAYYFPNALFAILYASLVLLFICNLHKSVIAYTYLFLYLFLLLLLFYYFIFVNITAEVSSLSTLNLLATGFWAVSNISRVATETSR
jgi:hypothetical protein